MVAVSEQYVREVKLRRERVSAFDQYPFSLPAVRNLHTLTLHPEVTFIVGENGSGKSTLLEAIAVAWGFNPEGGTKNFQFQTRGSHSTLHEHLMLVKGIKRPKDGFFLRAESFFNLATDIERMDAEIAEAPLIIHSYGGRSLHEQSHGESFFALMMHRFGGQGFYVLDEPEAAPLSFAPACDDRAHASSGADALSVHHRDSLTDSHGVPRRVALSDHPGRPDTHRVSADRALHRRKALLERSADAA